MTGWVQIGVAGGICREAVGCSFGTAESAD